MKNEHTNTTNTTCTALMVIDQTAARIARAASRHQNQTADCIAIYAHPTSTDQTEAINSMAAAAVAVVLSARYRTSGLKFMLDLMNEHRADQTAKANIEAIADRHTKATAEAAKATAEAIEAEKKAEQLRKFAAHL